MTTQTNAAAERLRDLHRDALVGWDSRVLDGMNKALDEALAAERDLAHDPETLRVMVDDIRQGERRATVERIRARAFDLTQPESSEPRRWAPNEMQLRAILDEEAAR